MFKLIKLVSSVLQRLRFMMSAILLASALSSCHAFAEHDDTKRSGDFSTEKNNYLTY